MNGMGGAGGGIEVAVVDYTREILGVREDGDGMETEVE